MAIGLGKSRKDPWVAPRDGWNFWRSMAPKWVSEKQWEETWKDLAKSAEMIVMRFDKHENEVFFPVLLMQFHRVQIAAGERRGKIAPKTTWKHTKFSRLLREFVVLKAIINFSFRGTFVAICVQKIDSIV